MESVSLNYVRKQNPVNVLWQRNGRQSKGFKVGILGQSLARNAKDTPMKIFKNFS